jgi:FkbH-like protein
MSGTEAASLDLVLACNFEPLSLARHFRQQLSRRYNQVALTTSGFGGLETTLQRVVNGELTPTRVVAIVEWADLDPRLGLRSELPLTRESLDSVISEARDTATRISGYLMRIGARAVLLPPTLALPPFFPTRPEHASVWQCALRSIAATLCEEVSAGGVLVVDVDCLEVPARERRSARNDVRFGFPYTESYAKDVAVRLAELIAPPARKKGLVLDLDGTLWKGIVGDDGVDAVRWDLDGKATGHALLQRSANLLADCGVLLGIVTKNESAAAHGGLGRADLIVNRERVWPVIAGWQQKSAGVRQVATSWNIGTDAMVMVDDSELELAEIENEVDGIVPLRFDGSDPDSVLILLTRLRALFGSPRTTEEDQLRAQSIRLSAELATVDPADTGRHETFLSGLNPDLIVSQLSAATRDRAIELVNKTNQFNLTSCRVGPADEEAFVSDGDVWLFEYSDRLARLGVIGVMRTEERDGTLFVSHWVLSCRAFARRVEHAMMAFIADRAGDRPLCLPFVRTTKNAPTERFLEDVLGGAPSTEDVWDGKSLLERLPHNRPIVAPRVR